ncbi:hypothetical protein D3C76_960620 [compost metagenome]
MDESSPADGWLEQVQAVRRTHAALLRPASDRHQRPLWRFHRLVAGAGQISPGSLLAQQSGAQRSDFAQSGRVPTAHFGRDGPPRTVHPTRHIMDQAPAAVLPNAAHHPKHPDPGRLAPAAATLYGQTRRNLRRNRGRASGIAAACRYHPGPVHQYLACVADAGSSDAPGGLASGLAGLQRRAAQLVAYAVERGSTLVGRAGAEAL